jgi:hypothetical protein
MELDPTLLTPARLAKLGFDVGALRARFYEQDDLPLLQAWWSSRHGEDLPVALLPPLGVVVEDASGEAIGMLWCYESFGVGVAWLEYPVTRPGLTMKQAGAVMAVAVMACMQVAGKECVPPASYHVFRVATSSPIARFLERLGFQFSDGGTHQRAMIFLN